VVDEVTGGPAVQGFALFDTAIGRCGIAWSERGIAGTQLPEERDAQTRARLRRRFPGAPETSPPPHAQRVIDAVAGLLASGRGELHAVALELDGLPDLDRRVYDVARSIPAGSTLTYGEVAARLGDPRLAREVGQALGRNPFAIVVPCHRVLAAGGLPGGFSASGGVATKMRLLAIEGARAASQLALFDGDGAFGVDTAAAKRASAHSSQSPGG
jgi:methylated-DNA-[protein]-cysteine S-methyltransferase